MRARKLAARRPLARSAHSAKPPIYCPNAACLSNNRPPRSGSFSLSHVSSASSPVHFCTSLASIKPSAARSSSAPTSISSAACSRLDSLVCRRKRAAGNICPCTAAVIATGVAAPAGKAPRQSIKNLVPLCASDTGCSVIASLHLICRYPCAPWVSRESYVFKPLLGPMAAHACAPRLLSLVPAPTAYLVQRSHRRSPSQRAVIVPSIWPPCRLDLRPRSEITAVILPDILCLSFFSFFASQLFRLIHPPP